MINRLECEDNYSATSNNTVGTLAVDGWAVTFDTARRGLDEATALPGHSLLYQMCTKRPLINGRCTNYGIVV